MRPKIAGIENLTSADKNTLVQFNNIQFKRNQLALTYAGEATDEFDGFRVLESCDNNSFLQLQTSTFADFKSLNVAQNKGSIQGVFSRDFNDGFNVLLLNSISDIEFDNTERCDPVLLNCLGSTAESFIVFEEDFQEITNEDQLDTMGWTNINVNGGNERYEDSSFSGDRYLKISAFGTNENPLEAWLVTPAINLDGTTDEELSFEVSTSFESGQVLTAFISDNFTGNIATTEWVQLNVDIPIGDDGFGNFVSLATNISCLNGDVYLAFKYLGEAGGAETRYHIDDIKVIGTQ